jgi:hypothetical protein
MRVNYHLVPEDKLVLKNPKRIHQQDKSEVCNICGLYKPEGKRATEEECLGHLLVFNHRFIKRQPKPAVNIL